MIFIIILAIIALTAFLIIKDSKREQTDTKPVSVSHPKPSQPPLTDAQREAIRQADEAFDWQTHNAIVNGNYNGSLPEHIVANHWTQLYPDLYHTKIAGINFRRGIKNLAGVYFDAILVAEPKNKYDPNAIKILHATDNRHIGYIPSDETDAVRKWVNNQLPYHCRAHIDEFEEWDDEKERDLTKLYGEISIKRPNVSPNNIIK